MVGKKRVRNYLGIVLVGTVLLVAFVAAAPFFHTTGTTSYLAEDQTPVFTYNFSANVSNVQNETLVFAVANITSTLHGTRPVSYFNWITIDATTGILTFNATTNNHTGNYNLSVEVVNDDPTPAGQKAVFYFEVNATNDAPTFINLVNQTLNNSYYELLLLATDEENDVPYTFNVSFVSCYHTSLNPPTGPNNCTLFNITSFNSTAANISFGPQDSQEGEYIINFSVQDLENTISPTNATFSILVNWTLSWNNDPSFTYVCDDISTGTEDTPVNCYINASDSDELYNLTFAANYTWFLFNETNNYTTTINTTAGAASTYVNFTPGDAQVGTWVVNVTVTDSGPEVLVNSTTYTITIGNVNDSVSIIPFSNLTAYTSNNYTVYVNATDDDLLISDPSVYAENLTFSANVSWVTVTSNVTVGGTNRSVATLFVNPTLASEGNHSVNVSVVDANSYSQDSYIFIVEVIGNGVPRWNETTQSAHALTEGTAFYLNLTQNVTDPQDDSLSFTFRNDTAFPTFSIDSATGVISFTPIDADVGQHIVVINASDGVTPASYTFNFTVANIDDTASFETPITATNASVDSLSNLVVQEDNRTIISVFIQDNDYRIPLVQKGFYNESLSLAVTLEGPNTNLFSFSSDSSFPTSSGISANRSLFTATFTPNKTDVGNYNITLNVTDVSNSSVILTFNMTILAINHDPNITEVANISSSINQTVYLDINATDIEEGNETVGNLTYQLTFLGDGKSDDFYLDSELVFNSSTGILNITFNTTQYGEYHLNVTVNDTEGAKDSTDFWLLVYDAPVLHAPGVSYTFELTEGVTTNITLDVNHTLEDNLTYLFYLDSQLQYNVSSYGNSTNVTWAFMPNYTDETYGQFANFTVVISNPTFSSLQVLQNWSMNISYANAPANFSSTIPNQVDSAGSTITLNLSTYYFDPDVTDPVYNQTLNITVESNTTSTTNITITPNASLLTVTFYSASAITETINITIADLNSSGNELTTNTSNSFNVTFIAAVSSSSSSSSGGGGGGSSSSSTVAGSGIEVDPPGPQTLDIGSSLITSFDVVNLDDATLENVVLTYGVSKDGVARPNDWIITFGQNTISSLAGDSSQTISFTALPTLIEEGQYEVAITATSGEITDTDILYINVEGDAELEVFLQFVQGFIDESQVCLEVQELIDQAFAAFSAGDYELASQYADSALQGCEQLITEQAQTQLAPPNDRFLGAFFSGNPAMLWLILVAVCIVMAFVGYDMYVRFKLKKLMNTYDDLDDNEISQASSY